MPRNRIDRFLPDAPEPRVEKLRLIRTLVRDRAYETREKLSRALDRLVAKLRG
jgi:hypothetical protein